MKIDKYLKFKSKKVQVFLELEGNFIKVVSRKFSKSQPLLFLIKEEISFKDEDGLASGLRKILATYNLSPSQVFLNLPRYLTIARFLNLPSTDENEIKDMVDIESLKQIPYRGEDIVIGYRIIERLKNGYSDVLFAVTEIDTINRLLNILKKANIELEKIALSSESLLAWYYLMRDKSRIEYKDTLALINLDSQYIDIDIVEKEKLKFSRAFLYSTDSDNKSQEAIEEIKKSLTTYQRQSDRQINKIIITGAPNKIEQLLTFGKSEINIDLEVIPQTENLEFEQKTEADLSEVSFAGLLGLSQKGQEAKINLLPKNIIENNRLKALKRDIRKTLILLILVVLFFGLVSTKRILDKIRYLNFLETEIESRAEEVARARTMRERIKVIKKEIQKKPLAIEILTEVYKVAPQNLQLSLLDYKSGKFLVLKGAAPSLNDIISLVSKLNESKYFENTQIRYTTKRKTSRKNLTDFELICNLSKIR